MDINDLSPELREKVKACTSPEELFALAKREGYELSEEETEAISGGWVGPCDDFKPTIPHQH
jgi:predicted ribosomally synthesized peptide with nif11-like leader